MNVDLEKLKQAVAMAQTRQRAEFATAALTGILAGRLHVDAVEEDVADQDNVVPIHHTRDLTPDEIADYAFSVADAMMKVFARSRYIVGPKDTDVR